MLEIVFKILAYISARDSKIRKLYDNFLYFT